MQSVFQSREPICAELREIIAMTWYADHPAIEIGVPGVHLASPKGDGSGDVLLDSFIVLDVKSVARERMRAVASLNHDVGVSHRGRPGAPANFAVGNDTLSRKHDAFGGPRQESITKSRARVLPIPIDIRLPDVNDGPIGMQRWDSEIRLAVDRIVERHVIRIKYRNGSADAASPRQKTEAARSGIELRIE